jgi:molybdopterin/thiamine biosynthesis adenylyltransferase
MLHDAAFGLMNRELERYHRQMLLPGLGADGQQQLLESTALLLGCGALGSVAADLLARAGVGRLIIVDRDILELTNLQRQVLFDEQDVADGLPKAEAAKRQIAKRNSQVDVTAIVDDINHTNIEHFADGADILIDGLDNLETRYLANDFAVKAGLPYVYGAAVGTTGMSFTVLPRGAGGAWESTQRESLATPCLRCLFEEALPPGAGATCDTVGVLGPVIGLVASFQAAEALKIMTANFDRVSRTILHVDLWGNELLSLPVAESDHRCPCCADRQFDYLEGRTGSTAAVLCGRDAVQLRQNQRGSGIDLEALATRLEGHGAVHVNDFMLKLQVADGDHEYELMLFPDGRAIVKGTSEPGAARALYARYIGS